MNKILKVSLLKDQVEKKRELQMFDGYEVHLLGNGRDDFDLLEKLNDKPIVTFHYPVDDCQLGVFSFAGNERYIEKIIDSCAKYNSGLVMHCGTGWGEPYSEGDELQKVKENKDLHVLINMLKEANVPLHIENASSVECRYVLQVTAYLTQTFQYFNVFPLLDVCHYLIASQRPFSRELNLATTIEAFDSNNFKVHFCDCIGCGKNNLGGIHGTNFKYNLPLMQALLDCFMKMPITPDLILEVDEKDFCDPQNAIWLANQIDKYLATKNKLA